MHRRKFRIGDRLFSIVAVATAAIAITAWSGHANAQTRNPLKNKPIRIGFLAPQTGFLAQPGKDMLRGFKLYLSEHHNELGGRPVKLFVADSQAKPSVALSQLRKLVENDNIQLLVGPLASADAIALRRYINAHHLPTVFPVTSANNFTQRKMSPYIIRTGWANSQVTLPFGEYAYKKLGYHRIVTIGFAFSFGYETVAGFEQSFQQAGGKVIERLWPPVSQQDYSAYISKIEAAHPQAVFAVFAGGDAVRFLKQWRSFGVKIPLIALGNMTGWSVLPGEGKTALGVTTALQYSANLKNPENQKFVHAYESKYHQRPAYYAEGCYTAAMFLQHAAKATGGDIEDKAAFLNALRQAKVNAPRGPVKIGPWQNPIENVYILRVEKEHGHLANKVIHTYHHMSQFWKYNPAWFLSQPAFSRKFPKCNACKSG